MRSALRSLAVLALLTTAAHAAPGDQLVVYGGEFDVTQQDDPAAMAGVEYRFKDQFNGLRPTVGLMADTDGAAYAYGGAYWDLPLNTAPFVISPGFAIGAYEHGGGKNLGSVLEFRSTIEAAYQMNDGEKIGLGFSHMSNAGIGSDNPGAEMLQLVYSHPM